MMAAACDWRGNVPTASPPGTAAPPAGGAHRVHSPSGTATAADGDRSTATRHHSTPASGGGHDGGLLAVG